MVYKDNNVKQSTLVIKRLDDGIPDDHMCRFIKKMISKEYNIS